MCNSGHTWLEIVSVLALLDGEHEIVQLTEDIETCVIGTSRNGVLMPSGMAPFCFVQAMIEAGIWELSPGESFPRKMMVTPRGKAMKIELRETCERFNIRDIPAR